MTKAQDKILQAAIEARLSTIKRLPEEVRNKLQAMADINGESLEDVVSFAIKNRIKDEAIAERYAIKTARFFESKHPSEMTPEQRNKLVDFLSDMLPPADHKVGDSEQERAKKEEERRLYLLNLLAEIHDDDTSKGYRPYSGLFRGFASGGYVGGDASSPEKLKLNLDKVAAMGDDGQRIAAKYRKEISNPNPQTPDEARATVVEFFRRFKGEREHGSNMGPLVQLTMGYQGGPYCGGGLNMGFDRVFGFGLFDQKNWYSAASFEQIGAKFGAIRPAGERPKPGDVIVLSGSGASGRHVGVVTAVSASGEVSYLDFNGSDDVRERKLNRPVVAYVDIEKLAAAKNKDMPLHKLIVEAQKDFATKYADVKIEGSSVAAVAAPVGLPSTAAIRSEPQMATAAG